MTTQEWERVSRILDYILAAKQDPNGNVKKRPPRKPKKQKPIPPLKQTRFF